MKRISLVIFFSIAIIACHKEDQGSTIVFKDALIDNRSGWPLNGNYICKFSNNQLEVTSLQINEFLCVFCPFQDIHYSYSIDVDAAIHLNDPNSYGYVGILLNYTNEDNFIAFYICSSGEYGVLSKSIGVYQYLTPLTFSQYVNKTNGAFNHLTVIQNKSTMQVLINSNLINSYNISAPGTCQSGIIIETEQNAPTYVFADGYFKNYVITRL